MKFRQFEDGGGMLMFNEEEVKILSEKKCLTFDAEFFKHFKNELMGLVVNFERFNKNKQHSKLTTQREKEIKAK